MARVDREGTDQAALFVWARMVRLSSQEVIDGVMRRHTLADFLIWIPNGVGKLSPFVAQKMRAQGLKAGVSDLLLPLPKGGYHGLWCEFKASPPYNAAVTADQLVWIERMKFAGYAACVAQGWPEAARKLMNYLAEEWHE